MLLNEIIPNPLLTEIVRCFRIIDFQFPDNIIIPAKAYPPRPELCLQFFPTPTTITYNGTAKLVTPTNASFVGLHTVTNNRIVHKKFLSIQVIFQPAGFFRLFGMTAEALTNQFIDAEIIIGEAAALINEQLFLAKGYPEMIAIIEKFLLKRMQAQKKDKHGIDMIAQKMLTQYDQLSLDGFVKEAFLSKRQFDRKFYERIGVNPKEYIRMIRFDKAFRMKNRFPDKDWLTIALHCGYYDYQHLSKDYVLYTGYTPPVFFEIDNRAPERIFGEAEV